MPLSEEELQHIVKKLQRVGFEAHVMQSTEDEEYEPVLTPQERWDAMIRRLSVASQAGAAD